MLFSMLLFIGCGANTKNADIAEIGNGMNLDWSILVQ